MPFHGREQLTRHADDPERGRTFSTAERREALRLKDEGREDEYIGSRSEKRGEKSTLVSTSFVGKYTCEGRCHGVIG